MICKICGEDKCENEFLKPAKRYKTCKVCSNLIKNNITKPLDKWSIEEYKIILDNILNDRIKYIDEILPSLNNKTINELVGLLHTSLKIKNKPLMLKYKCSQCGKSFDSRMLKMNNKNVFCCSECYYQYKRENTLKGKDSPYYNRISCKCDNCNNDIEVPKSDYDKVNSYGENHNFCSQECYWEFRSKYYVKEKANGYNKEYSQKERNIQRERILKMYDDGIFSKKITIPHKLINGVLDYKKIKYINEHKVAFYSMDIFLNEYNLYIEIMGDYFHANPCFYNFDELNSIQLKDKKQDKSKHTYFKNNKQIEILYLWEHDIKNNIDICKELICKYINSDGILESYNSFNYYMDDGFLKLKKEIKIPYFITNP